MIKLIAALFAIVNGVPAEQPSRVLTYNKTFDTKEACMAFGKTDEGLALRQSLNEYIMSQRGTVMAKIGCVEAEDNTI